MSGFSTSLTSPALTGTPTATTAATGTNTTQLATTAFTQQEIAAKAGRGALVKKAADQTTANYTAGGLIAWDAESYDTDAIHDNATNNSRLTVPAGVTKVIIKAQVVITSITADLGVILLVQKAGADFEGQPALNSETGLTHARLNIASAVLTVTAGDYFEAYLQIETDTSVTVESENSWFAMEIVE